MSCSKATINAITRMVDKKQTMDKLAAKKKTVSRKNALGQTMDNVADKKLANKNQITAADMKNKLFHSPAKMNRTVPSKNSSQAQAGKNKRRRESGKNKGEPKTTDDQVSNDKATPAKKQKKK